MEAPTRTSARNRPAGRALRRIATGVSLALGLLAAAYLAKRLLRGPGPGVVTWALGAASLAGSAVLCWAARRAKLVHVARALLALGSCLLAAVSAEYALWRLTPASPPAVAWRDELLRRRAAGEPVYPILGYTGQEELGPFLSGVGNVLTMGFPGEPSVHDRHGFNNPAGYYDQHARFALLMVGDSLVHGGQIAARLRERIPGGVYNAGYAGNGPLTELATLVEYGTPKRPQVVLWCFYEGNDFKSDLPSEVAKPFLAGYLTDAHPRNLVARDDERTALFKAYLDRKLAALAAAAPPQPPSFRDRAEAMRRWFAEFPEWSQLYRWLHRLPRGQRIWGSTLDGVPASVPAAFARTMDVAQATVQAWGGRLVVAYLPEYRRFLYPRRYTDAVRTFVLSCLAERGIPAIDLTPRFAADLAPQRLFTGAEAEPGEMRHYSEAGYGLAADTMLAQLGADVGIR